MQISGRVFCSLADARLAYFKAMSKVSCTHKHIMRIIHCWPNVDSRSCGVSRRSIALNMGTKISHVTGEFACHPCAFLCDEIERKMLNLKFVGRLSAT